MSNESAYNRSATSVTSIETLIGLLAGLGDLELGTNANSLPRRLRISFEVDDEAVEALERTPGAKRESNYHTFDGELQCIVTVEVQRGCVTICAQATGIPMTAVVR
jgi:hypothetical protein